MGEQQERGKKGPNNRGESPFAARPSRLWVRQAGSSATDRALYQIEDYI